MKVGDYYRHTILSSVSNPQYVFNSSYYNLLREDVKRREKALESPKGKGRIIDKYV